GARVTHLCIFSPYQQDGDPIGVRMTGIRSGLFTDAVSRRKDQPGEKRERWPDVVTLLEEAVHELGGLKCGERISFSPEAEYCGVRGHPLLKVAFQNLINHRADRSPEGTGVRISLSADIKGINISIVDDNANIDSPRNRPITHREESSDGLETERGIIELHGGELRADNGLGPGGSSVISLPWSEN
ncbi:MAG: hypothetical protein ACMUHY_07755, partial [Thermoplasmatota archaeon]